MFKVGDRAARSSTSACYTQTVIVRRSTRVMPGVRVVALIIMGLGYAWVASAARTFTRPAEALTAVPIAVVAIALARSGRDERQPVDEMPARWLSGWAVLALVTFAWEMRELFGRPRYAYPTLSSIGDAVVRSSRFAHAAIFALWLAIGYWLGRRPSSRRVA
jgi:hypothetical protein